VGLGVDLLIALLLFVTRIRCRIRTFIDAYMLSDGPFERNFVGMRNRPGVMVVGGPVLQSSAHFSNSRFCKMSIISQHEVRNYFGESIQYIQGCFEISINSPLCSLHRLPICRTFVHGVEDHDDSTSAVSLYSCMLHRHARIQRNSRGIHCKSATL
jgi:hypothetical protein